MAYPEEVYRKILAMPDDEVTRTASYATPPVPAPPASGHAPAGA
jgi:hypothetical protein